MREIKISPSTIVAFENITDELTHYINSCHSDPSANDILNYLLIYEKGIGAEAPEKLLKVAMAKKALIEDVGKQLKIELGIPQSLVLHNTKRTRNFKSKRQCDDYIKFYALASANVYFLMPVMLIASVATFGISLAPAGLGFILSSMKHALEASKFKKINPHMADENFKDTKEFIDILQQQQELLYDDLGEFTDKINNQKNTDISQYKAFYSNIMDDINEKQLSLQIDKWSSLQSSSLYFISGAITGGTIAYLAMGLAVTSVMISPIPAAIVIMTAIVIGMLTRATCNVVENKLLLPSVDSVIKSPLHSIHNSKKQHSSLLNTWEKFNSPIFSKGSLKKAEEYDCSLTQLSAVK